jgi:hypothetical protein
VNEAAVSYVRGIAPDAVNRERDDFYPTPPRATLALLRVESFAGSIWEPACGDGAISKVLIEHGYQVISTDLIDRGYGTPNVDFTLDYQTRADNVITNPPFKHAQQFVEHALSRTTGKVAILARLAWLEGSARKVFFESTPLRAVYVFSKRLPLWRGRAATAADSGGMIAFAWYVWQHGFKGSPFLRWL